MKRLLASVDPTDDWQEKLPEETQKYLAFIVPPVKDGAIDA